MDASRQMCAVSSRQRPSRAILRHETSACDDAVCPRRPAGLVSGVRRPSFRDLGAPGHGVTPDTRACGLAARSECAEPSRQASLKTEALKRV
jgi:hypothetical protein